MESFALKTIEGNTYTVHYFPELGSTNDKASSGQYVEGDVVVCGRQLRGRGQRGNGWYGGPGLNLTFSVVVQPRFLPAAEQFALSETVSVAVADILEECGIRSSIKWPNDIYVGDRKIAGILIENDICGNNISRSVIGIGLNINETAFPAELPNPVSMAAITGVTYDLEGVLREFLKCFDNYYTLLGEGAASAIAAEYHGALYRKVVPSQFRLPSGRQFTGTIECVRPSGQLVVRSERGREEFLFKEIEFVI